MSSSRPKAERGPVGWRLRKNQCPGCRIYDSADGEWHFTYSDAGPFSREHWLASYEPADGPRRLGISADAPGLAWLELCRDLMREAFQARKDGEETEARRLCGLSVQIGTHCLDARGNAIQPEKEAR